MNTKKGLEQEITILRGVLKKYEALTSPHSTPVMPMVLSKDGVRGIGRLKLTQKTLVVRIQIKYLLEVLRSLQDMKVDENTVTFAFTPDSILGIGEYDEPAHELVGHLIAPMARR